MYMLRQPENWLAYIRLIKTRNDKERMYCSIDFSNLQLLLFLGIAAALRVMCVLAAVARRPGAAASARHHAALGRGRL
jgi:hypothetical protein